MFDAVLLDLDGTVYHEDQPLPGALALLARLARDEQPYACLSNSASSPHRVSERLREMGAQVPPEAIYTAAAAACDYIVDTIPGRPRVFNLATLSIDELLAGRADMVESADDPCDVVLAGGPSNVRATEPRQRLALALLRNGASLVGLCADRVFPSRRGLEFGAGAMCAMLGYAANVTPTYCGKPDPIFFRELCRRVGVNPSRCLLIGDNLESDVMGARRVGMTSALVLSGITRREDLERLPVEARPDIVIESLEELTDVSRLRPRTG